MFRFVPKIDAFLGSPIYSHSSCKMLPHKVGQILYVPSTIPVDLSIGSECESICYALALTIVASQGSLSPLQDVGDALLFSSGLG